LYDFKATAVNSFHSSSEIYFYIFFAFPDTNERKNARLSMKTEFFSSFKEYSKQAARVLLSIKTELGDESENS
jgi:hypothetical protein